jgi:hypothetical protein
MHDSIDPGIPPAAGFTSPARDSDSPQAGTPAGSRATLTLSSRSPARAVPPVSNSQRPGPAQSGPIMVRKRGDGTVHMVERVSAGAHQGSRPHASEPMNPARWS